ncbi:MAG: hypothetical protein QM757_26635 [Paludibaculum sp.]
MTSVKTRLFTSLLLTVIATLAADAPKPPQNKPLPDAAKVKILSANAVFMNLKSNQQQLRLQANDMEGEINKALAALNKEINEARAAAGCAAVTPDLECVPPPAPAAAEAKPDKKE